MSRLDRIRITGRLIREGYSTTQIAHHFGVTYKTAENYVEAAYARDEVHPKGSIKEAWAPLTILAIGMVAVPTISFF